MDEVSLDSEVTLAREHVLPTQLEPYKWQPGQTGNPTGRAGKSISLKELLQNQPTEKKRELVDLLYRAALVWPPTAVSMKAIDAILVHSGEGAQMKLTIIEAGTPYMLMIREIQERMGLLPADTETPSIEGESESEAGDSAHAG